MTTAPGATPLRLALARACAWALLVAGWIGLGALALRVAPVGGSFALVALWLLALGVAARIDPPRALARPAGALLLAGCAALTAAALLATVRGGGLAALVAALLGWAALTALASGVVRSLRQQQPAAPAPPVAAATLGALAAGLALGDPGDAQALALRLALFVAAAAGLLVLLQPAAAARAGGCRAGLFDCSLPAWPAGAWRDLRQWPTLLAGLAMLPMMAALPLMAAWCRADGLAPQAMLLTHLGAMFVPALLLQRVVARASTARLATLCAALLVTGAALAGAAAPWNLLGLASAHGAAWGLAWAGQLWAPARRGQQGSSPLRAAAGYALATLLVGAAIERQGAAGLTAIHVALGGAAALAWLVGAARGARAAAAGAPADSTLDAPADAPADAAPRHR